MSLHLSSGPDSAQSPSRLSGGPRYTVGMPQSELPPPPRIRAADRDRDAVLGVITDAVSNGRLDPEETAERQDAAIAAKFLDELMPLIEDLPEGHDLYRTLQLQSGIAPSGEISPRAQRGPAPLSPIAPPGSSNPVNSLAVLSGREVDVPAGTAEVTTYALMGGDDIDLCEVMGPGVTLTVTSFAMWAGHTIYVPPGVRIRDETINLLAGNEVKRDARGDGSNGTLVLKGFSLMAGHDVRLAKGYRPKDQRSLH